MCKGEQKFTETPKMRSASVPLSCHPRHSVKVLKINRQSAAREMSPRPHCSSSVTPPALLSKMSETVPRRKFRGSGQIFEINFNWSLGKFGQMRLIEMSKRPFHFGREILIVIQLDDLCDGRLCIYHLYLTIQMAERLIAIYYIILNVWNLHASSFDGVPAWECNSMIVQ